jgi:hypothetical protein
MSMKTKDRCGKLGRSANVIENKGTYKFMAGMLLKTKEVDVMW